MTAREAIARLLREGFTEDAGHGSHRVYRRAATPDGPARKVIVAFHRGDIPKGTLRQICHQAGWEWPPAR